MPALGFTTATCHSRKGNARAATDHNDETLQAFLDDVLANLCTVVNEQTARSVLERAYATFSRERLRHRDNRSRGETSYKPLLQDHALFVSYAMSLAAIEERVEEQQRPVDELVMRRRFVKALVNILLHLDSLHTAVGMTEVLCGRSAADALLFYSHCSGDPDWALRKDEPQCCDAKTRILDGLTERFAQLLPIAKQGKSRTYPTRAVTPPEAVSIVEDLHRFLPAVSSPWCYRTEQSPRIEGKLQHGINELHLQRTLLDAATFDGFAHEYGLRGTFETFLRLPQFAQPPQAPQPTAGAAPQVNLAAFRSARRHATNVRRKRTIKSLAVTIAGRTLATMGASMRTATADLGALPLWVTIVGTTDDGETVVLAAHPLRYDGTATESIRIKTRGFGHVEITITYKPGGGVTADLKNLSRRSDARSRVAVLTRATGFIDKSFDSFLSSAELLVGRVCLFADDTEVGEPFEWLTALEATRPIVICVPEPILDPQVVTGLLAELQVAPYVIATILRRGAVPHLVRPYWTQPEATSRYQLLDLSLWHKTPSWRSDPSLENLGVCCEDESSPLIANEVLRIHGISTGTQCAPTDIGILPSKCVDKNRALVKFGVLSDERLSLYTVETLRPQGPIALRDQPGIEPPAQATSCEDPAKATPMSLQPFLVTKDREPGKASASPAVGRMRQVRVFSQGGWEIGAWSIAAPSQDDDHQRAPEQIAQGVEACRVSTDEVHEGTEVLTADLTTGSGADKVHVTMPVTFTVVLWEGRRKTVPAVSSAPLLQDHD